MKLLTFPSAPVPPGVERNTEAEETGRGTRPVSLCDFTDEQLVHMAGELNGIVINACRLQNKIEAEQQRRLA